MRISMSAMAAAFLLLFVSASNAADVSFGETASDWSGLYIGASVGYGAASFDGITDTSEGTETVGSDEDSTWMSGNLQDGLTYGGYTGFNIHNAGIVFGLEADFGGAEFSETTADEDGADIDTHDVDWIGTFRGRVGGTYENTLLYVTGGVALAGSTLESTNKAVYVDAKTGTDDLLSFGYVVGAGLEHRFHENASLRLEGLYYGAMNKHTYNEEELHGDMDSGDYAKIDGMLLVRVGLGYYF
jgi:outer membrane immunogenic protein